MRTVAEIKTARLRLSALLEEAGKIIRDNPELIIARITIDHVGVHTLIKIPGADIPREETSA